MRGNWIQTSSSLVNGMNKVVFLIVFLSIAIGLHKGISLAEGENARHGGDLIFIKPVKAVIFSHKAHTEDLGLHCAWCHGETFTPEALNIQADAELTMESFCNEEYCGTCHNGDISFSTQSQCDRCHIGAKGYNKLIKQGRLDPEEESSDDTTGKAYRRLKEANK